MNFSKISAALSSIPDGFNGKVAKIGWLESAQYPDGTEVAYVAAIQEFGSPEKGIPPRPFIQPTIDTEQANWLKIMIDGAKQVQDGKIDAEDVLRAVGVQAAGDIRKAIANVTSPALKESTVKARARKYKSGKSEVTKSLTKPLIDSGLMISSCTNSVGAPDAD